MRRALACVGINLYFYVRVTMTCLGSSAVGGPDDVMPSLQQQPQQMRIKLGRRQA
jgi:hypothetical protein